MFELVQEVLELRKWVIVKVVTLALTVSDSAFRVMYLAVSQSDSLNVNSLVPNVILVNVMLAVNSTVNVTSSFGFLDNLTPY